MTDTLSQLLTLIRLALFAVGVVTSSGFDVIRRYGCPEACHCGVHQRIVDCGYKSLVRLPLHVPDTVRHYSVAGNRIYWISADSLFDLDELLSLDLSENFISHLPNDLFNSTPNLHILRLSGNRLESIPALCLLRLQHLQQLFLSRNKILSIAGETRFSSQSLLTFDLSGNDIADVPDHFLDRFPRLLNLRLSKNRLTSLEIKKWAGHRHGLEVLDVASNSIDRITWNDVVYDNLTVLNASNNLLSEIDVSWFVAMPNLNVLELCGNQFGSFGNNTFQLASNLRQLRLCELPNVHFVDIKSFAGLHLLKELDFSSNYNLSSIHPNAFTTLHHLQYLNVRNSGLRTLQPLTAGSDLEAVKVHLAGSRWLCDCRLKWLYDAHVTRGSDIGKDIVCSAPPELRNVPLFEVRQYEFLCETYRIVNVHISTTVILHCPIDVYQQSQVVWTTSRGTVIQSVVSYSNSEQVPSVQQSSFSVVHKGANISEKFDNGRHIGGHFNLLNNGSLLVKDISRGDTGRYVCTVVNSHENVSTTTKLLLNYTYMSSVMLFSVVVGAFSACGFLLVAVIVGTVRQIAYSCSANERKKRRSLRELLGQMRSNAQFDRFSAYRAAQMDRLSAFKSATMDQLSAFTSHRIGRLRKYKQATVTSVLQHLERMREQYSAQMDNIKESYRLNAARLRHSYAARFRDGQSISMRKQYRASVARARDYTNEQIARLRDQYKQQQQYLLKLLELIDVGSCVSRSVEAECMRAESAIFDATMTLDEEARPSYARRPPDDRGLFASSSSLPDDCHHCPLPAASPSAVDFCGIDNYSAVDVAVAQRATSAPSMQDCMLANCDRSLLQVHSDYATVYCQKAMSSPAIVKTVYDATDV